jgi:dihydropteroate synthase
VKGDTFLYNGLKGGYAEGSDMELLGGRNLEFSHGPLVMGIVNCTPDSFFTGSRVYEAEDAIERARKQIAAGASIIDIGGESSRPGSEYVDAQTECSRIIPVIEGIRAFSRIPISVDTRKASVAQKAVRAGADIINDISALCDDAELAPFVAETGVPVILMHMRGNPKTMQEAPYYENTLSEVKDELSSRVESALKAGILREKIILDPGIGFGKRLEDNLRLIAGLKELRGLGFPLLLGASRKGFIGTVTGKPVEERLAGSLAVAAYAAMAGVEIIRVHDVGETVDVIRIIRAIQEVDADVDI